MIKIKNFLLIFISLGLIGGLFVLKDMLLEKIVDYFHEEPRIIIEPGNNYTKDDDFLFVKEMEDFVPSNYNDLINIFYSILNKGWLEFTFYCPSIYTDCLNDVDKISNDKTLLSDINNYVHPYNSYSTIRTVYDDTGVVTIYINRLYSLTEIIDLNKTIDNLMNNLLYDGMSDRDKIKVLHDYIVANTEYDSERADNGSSDYDSARMLGALYDHYAICSGYTDLMAVMLEKLDIPNFKVASDTHIWNAVFIDGNWLHLDLTWDDPINAKADDPISETFFLISTDKLKEEDNKTNDHVFDINRYMEFS